MDNLKRFYSGIIAAILFSLSISGQSYVKTYPAPEGAQRSYDFIVKVNGELLDLYGADTRYGNLASFGYFDLNGSVEVELEAPFGPHHSTSFTFLPEHLGIEPNWQDNRKIKFTIDRPMKLTIVVTGDFMGNVLHLFANETETDIPSANDPKVLYFGPGFHDIGSENKWEILPKDNQTVYIAGGAYVKGHILVKDAKNVTIKGRGVLAQFKDMSNHIGLEIVRSQDVSVSGIIETRNRQHWSGLIKYSRNVVVKDYKVVSPPIWSSDGMNAINSQNIVYDDCFMRSGDDCIAIKGFGSTDGRSINDDPNNGAPNENITIKNSIFWSDNNNALVLGQESKADYYRNITVENCDILFTRNQKPHCAALSIVCVHSTDFNDIVFKNIRVHGLGQLIRIFYPDMIFRSMKGDHQWPGEIDGVTFENISATGLGLNTIRIDGYSKDKKVKNVTFKNVKINDNSVNKKSDYVVINKFTKNIKFSE